jgi:hypothetical protein
MSGRGTPCSGVKIAESTSSRGDPGPKYSLENLWRAPGLIHAIRRLFQHEINDEFRVSLTKYGASFFDLLRRGIQAIPESVKLITKSVVLC